MSYQVGMGCYADVQSAYAVLCASHAPAWTHSINASVLVECVGSDDLGLVYRRTLYEVGAEPGTEYFVASPALAPCVWSDWVEAGAVIFVAVLSAWCAWWGIRKIMALVDHYARVD